MKTTLIIIILMLAVLIAIMVTTAMALRKLSRDLDNLRFDMEESMGKEREARQNFDNTIMVKLHERYDTLVRWMDRLGKEKRNNPKNK